MLDSSLSNKCFTDLINARMTIVGENYSKHFVIVYSCWGETLYKKHKNEAKQCEMKVKHIMLCTIIYSLLVTFRLTIFT